MGKAKVIYLAWDLGSRSYITLHFCAKVVKKNHHGRVSGLSGFYHKVEEGLLATTYTCVGTQPTAHVKQLIAIFKTNGSTQKGFHNVLLFNFSDKGGFNGQASSIYRCNGNNKLIGTQWAPPCVAMCFLKLGWGNLNEPGLPVLPYLEQKCLMFSPPPHETNCSLNLPAHMTKRGPVLITCANRQSAENFAQVRSRLKTITQYKMSPL